MKVRLTPSALREFLEVIAFIREAHPDAARASRRRTETKLRRLERFPRSGRHLPEFPDLLHREVIVAPYRFFYRVVVQGFWVVGVWHGAQAPTEPTA